MLDDDGVRAAGERFPITPALSTHFAWLRTRLSAERTMMACIRTAIALIGFGFTIVEFFERFGSFEGVSPAARAGAPRYVGLALLGAGVLVLVVSTWQYHSVLTYLWSEQYQGVRGIDEAPHRTATYAISFVMIFVGLFAFFVVLFRAF